jgi:hypothetical protein
MPSQLRNLMRAQGRDLHTEFLGLLPERPRPIAIQRWSIRRVALAALALLAGAVLVNLAWSLLISDDGIDNASIQAQALRCAPHEPLLLMAQSVPTASLVPCVQALPAGWTLGEVQVGDGRSRILLNSDRGGVLTVELTGSCDLAGAQEQVSTDQTGTRLFQPANAASTATRWYLFPGGCITQRLDASTNAGGGLVQDASPTLGFTTREALRAALRRDSGGRLQLDVTTR